MKKTKGTNASIFELNGIPQLSKALPLKSNLSRGVELIRSMMLSTQFTDEKRIYEVLAQVKSS